MQLTLCTFSKGADLVALNDAQHVSNWNYTSIIGGSCSSGAEGGQKSGASTFLPPHGFQSEPSDGSPCPLGLPREVAVRTRFFPLPLTIVTSFPLKVHFPYEHRQDCKTSYRQTSFPSRRRQRHRRNVTDLRASQLLAYFATSSRFYPLVPPFLIFSYILKRFPIFILLSFSPRSMYRAFSLIAPPTSRSVISAPASFLSINIYQEVRINGMWRDVV